MGTGWAARTSPLDHRPGREGGRQSCQGGSLIIPHKEVAVQPQAQAGTSAPDLPLTPLLLPGCPSTLPSCLPESSRLTLPAPSLGRESPSLLGRKFLLPPKDQSRVPRSRGKQAPRLPACHPQGPGKRPPPSLNPPPHGQDT